MAGQEKGFLKSFIRACVGAVSYSDDEYIDTTGLECKTLEGTIQNVNVIDESSVMVNKPRKEYKQPGNTIQNGVNKEHNQIRQQTLNKENKNSQDINKKQIEKQSTVPEQSNTQVQKQAKSENREIQTEVKKPHTNSEILAILNLSYNNQVMCTNGLFHMYDKFRNELYINKHTGKIDDRASYKTIYVSDKVIVAEVVNASKPQSVILDKDTLKWILVTKNSLNVIDNLIYETNSKADGEHRVFSDSGKMLATISNIITIEKAYKNLYIIKTQQMYEDKLVIFDNKTDNFKDLTKDKKYVIINRPGECIEVQAMNGGTYCYNFDDQTCINTFTESEEKGIQLWTIR